MFSIESRVITGSEIATLQEAKLYFRTEDSGGVEDALINQLITTARDTVERIIDRSLVTSTVTVFASEWKGYLPFGPINSQSVTITGVAALQGNKYPYAITSENTTITYTTEAYSNVALKSAVLELAFYWYERGEFTGGEVPNKIKAVVRPHKRLTFIA